MIKHFLPHLTATINRKGVLDVDTVKGCPAGMAKYPGGGCYQLCYAAKMARLYGYDFSKGTTRKPAQGTHKHIEQTVVNHGASWFRVGTMGEPCHDWNATVETCDWLGRFKAPVIITKHWRKLSDTHKAVLRKIGAVINTSVSALDDDAELKHRLNVHAELNAFGVKSVLRIVTAMFGKTEAGCEMKAKQDELIGLGDFIDTPLRIPTTDERVIRGDIVACSIKDMGIAHGVSLHKPGVYLGACGPCPDQCGVRELIGVREEEWQPKLFK